MGRTLLVYAETLSPLGEDLGTFAGSTDVEATRFEALDAKRLAEFNPDTIISGLVTPDFDILDLAAKLAQLGFAGRLIALSTPLPNPQVIRAEVRAVSQEFQFELRIIGENSR